MDALELLVRALPAHEATIRRRFWRDPEFRAVCEDYRDVLEAPARREASQPAASGAADELGELAAELLEEAEQMLRGEQE